MQEQLAIQRVLRKNLLAAQSKNSKYSLRSYSKKVGVHSGALSAIINGKRNVSREMAERILRNLLLDPQERSEILDLFPESAPTSLSASEPRYLEIEASEFKLLAEWEHFAVLNLIKCRDFRSDPEWIGARLGISVTRVREVLDRLLELGLIKTDPQGKLHRVRASLRSPDDVVDLSVRKSHEETLELARESLHRDSINERDFTSITMPVNPGKMSKAKEMIRKLQDDLYRAMSDGELTEVYRLSIQLFPLTKIPEESK